MSRDAKAIKTQREEELAEDSYATLSKAAWLFAQLCKTTHD
jgi:hypothetical protein